jgi:phosphoribosyl-ATP pyrophosphohydrolase/phosphoribosyl-AMP cyclohydrolase
MNSSTPPPPQSSSSDTLLAAVTFDAAGLVPVIAQEEESGTVRMFAWADREALRLTVKTGQAHFWSRSRQASWRKGETSGNALHVRDIRIDCDGDVVLYLVDADGPSCHTGHTSCFFRGLGGAVGGGVAGTVEGTAGSVVGPPTLLEDDGPADPPALIVKRVAETIARRRRERPEKSYVVSLLDGGWPKVLGKISEESGELVQALPETDAPHTAHEAADLLFHVLVGLEKAGVPVDDVFAELKRRFGMSGLQEKEDRPKASPTGVSPPKASPKT